MAQRTSPLALLVLVCFFLNRGQNIFYIFRSSDLDSVTWNLTQLGPEPLLVICCDSFVAITVTSFPVIIVNNHRQADKQTHTTSRPSPVLTLQADFIAVHSTTEPQNW